MSWRFYRHLALSLHSESSPSLTQISSISVKRSWGMCSSSSSSAPRRNCTLWEGVSVDKKRSQNLQINWRWNPTCVLCTFYNFDEMHHKGETLCPPPGWGPDPCSSSCACCHDVDAGDGCGAGCSPGGRGPRCRASCGLRAHCSEVRGGSTAMHVLSVDLHDPSALGDHALAPSLCAAPLGLMLLWRFACISWMFWLGWSTITRWYLIKQCFLLQVSYNNARNSNSLPPAGYVGWQSLLPRQHTVCTIHGWSHVEF